METSTRETTDLKAPSIDGVVRSDSMTKQLYSTDASIYEVEPAFVFFPVNVDDIRSIHHWSEQKAVSLIPRGAGTSLSGQAIGNGAIVDYSKHFDEILEWDPETGIVRVEPGVVLDHLNTFLGERDRQFGPDVATSNRATIGGMIGNNSAGAHSIRYGYTAQHVESLTCVLPNGETVTFEEVSREQAQNKAEQDTLEGELYDRVPELIERHGSLIEDQYPDLLRNVSGYGLDRFLEKLQNDTVDFTELICGSEGTLGAVVEAELRTVPAITKKSLIIVNCESLQDAVRVNRRVIEESPLAVELLDRNLLDLARDSLEISRYMDWLKGNPEAILIVEVGEETEGPALKQRIKTIQDAIRDAKADTATSIVRDPKRQKDVWKVRKSGLPLLLGISSDRKPTTFVEDTAVDPSRLDRFVSEFQEIVEDYGTTAAFYGHISVGCLHIRPLLDLKSSQGVSDMRAMTREVVELVKSHNGALSGEHGDGRSRSEWLDDFYSEEMVDVYDEVKTLFDPEHRFNPGNIVDAESMTENLRFGPDYEVNEWDIQQDFSEQGGFSEIIERCNGSGVCRKEESGSMCPSFMVTRDEEHSTRGRANALRGVISGELDQEALTDGRMEEVMDLCISCKACKSECPSEVDMAPLNQEVKHKVHQENGASLRERFFAAFGRFARWSEPLQPVVSWMQSLPFLPAVLKAVLGVAPERELPQLSPNPVSSSDFSNTRRTADDPVVLYTDTFTGYLEPGIFNATYSLLENLGFDPLVPEVPCCGRTYLSQGFLEKGRRQARATVETLTPYAEEDIPILGLEPSCHSALVDDYPRLVPGENTQAVAERTHLLSDFLFKKCFDRINNATSESNRDPKVWVHGHCHQKALLGEDSMVKLLKSATSGDVEFIDAGCCGMAGSFGYEKEHYDLSRKMAQRKLIPQVNRSNGEDRVVAPGLSCREQIEDFSSVSPEHPVELLADLVQPPNGR